MTMRNILASNTNLMASLHDNITAGIDEIEAWLGDARMSIERASTTSLEALEAKVSCIDLYIFKHHSYLI